MTDLKGGVRGAPVNVSIATIPPRFHDGSLSQCIVGFLNQTIDIKNIYINLPNTFTRFKNLTEREEDEIKNLSPKIIITKTDYDSPALKYLGCLKYLQDDDVIFVGDDDQVYHPNLLEKMLDGFYDDNAVFQNRFHIVKHGTAGIIHGFVGLMMKKKVFKNIHNFDLPSECWIDDQLMNIYFYLNKIRILPSPVNDFDEIFSKTSAYGTEQIGEGALCKMSLPRKKQIKELEHFYNVFFIDKNYKLGKGELKRVDYDKLKMPSIHFVILDQPTKENKENMLRMINKYDLEYNIWNFKQFTKDYPKVELKTTCQLNYWSNRYGLEKIKEDKNDAIYINRNLIIDKNFDLLEYVLNERNIYHNDNDILLIKDTFCKKV